ncbi:MAG: glycerol-3-phosphate dehydrogenase/oxidase [Chloroflexi bacterium]|nr:glycerol-3-phosphate dehydrogenase/oxidase [Chloroflexota bacterium]
MTDEIAIAATTRDPAAARRADLAALAAEEWDVVVVGGGVTGAGILLDAVSRGLRAALIEQSDIAAGTSSRSSRLIHGGLRYLEQFHIGLVREALAERARLLDLAPHLVSLRPLVFPLYGLPFATRAFYGAGIGFYRGGISRHLGVKATRELVPSIKPEGLRGSIVYHDGMEDDARYVMAVARTAAGLGGLVLTRVRADGLVLEGGRAKGLVATDLAGDAGIRIRAKHVIDATGVWAARADSPFGGARMVPSMGSHLVVPRERIPMKHGMAIRVPGKVAFIVPWPDFWVIGTTDAPYEGPPDRPTASRAEVDKLLDTVNTVLAVDLTADDIVGTFAGLRPLVGEAQDGGTVKVSREHKVAVDRTGLVRIGGGKYTTYRLMARDAVDAALGPAESVSRPSATAELPLVGAASRAVLSNLADRISKDHGLTAEQATRLTFRHGTEAMAVVELGRQRDLLRPLVTDRPFLEAEVVWAVHRELALSLDDVLARRFRLATEMRDRGASIAPRVADLVGDELGWDEARRRREVDAYLAGARREYGVPGVAGEAGMPVAEPAGTSAAQGAAAGLAASEA